MLIKKRIGPSTESCGTTQSTGIKSELYPLIQTNCLLSEK